MFIKAEYWREAMEHKCISVLFKIEENDRGFSQT